MIPAGTCSSKKGNGFTFEKKQSTDPRSKCVKNDWGYGSVFLLRRDHSYLKSDKKNRETEVLASSTEHRGNTALEPCGAGRC